MDNYTAIAGQLWPEMRFTVYIVVVRRFDFSSSTCIVIGTDIQCEPKIVATFWLLIFVKAPKLICMIYGN